MRLIAERLFVILEGSALVLRQEGQIEANADKVGLSGIVALLRVTVDDHLVAIFDRGGQILELLDVQRIRQDVIGERVLELTFGQMAATLGVAIFACSQAVL